MTSTTDAPAVRVLIADDHPLIREGLARTLREDARFDLVGEAANGMDAVSLAESTHPDLAVLDVRMPRINGIRALGMIRDRLPRTRVVLLSAFEDERLIATARSDGACGYLLKDADRCDVLEDLLRIHAGHVVCPVPRRRPVEPGPVCGGHEVTPRERSVLRLVRHGWEDRTVAFLLGLEDGEVERRMRSVMEKLGAADRDGAIEAARARGILA